MSKNTSVSVVYPSWEVWCMAKAIITVGSSKLPTPSSMRALS